MTETALSILSEFGAAGLIGVLWIIERRAATARERELREAHGRIMHQQRALDALLEVVRENTRAMTALEQTQRRVVELIDRLRERAAA